MPDPGETTSAPPGVRRMRASDLPDVGQLLARAFADDPTSAWLFPRVAGRAERLRRWYLANAELFLAVGEGWVTEDRSSVALWLAEGPVPERPPRPGQLGRLLWLNLDIAFQVRARLLRATSMTVRLRQLHPRQPSWHLAVLATDPAKQRQGRGTAVLAPGLARCDRTGVAAVLETATAVDVHFYRSRGFEVLGELDRPGSPHFWVMRRPPGGRGAAQPEPPGA